MHTILAKPKDNNKREKKRRREISTCKYVKMRVQYVTTKAATQKLQSIIRLVHGSLGDPRVYVLSRDLLIHRATRVMRVMFLRSDLILNSLLNVLPEGLAACSTANPDWNEPAWRNDPFVGGVVVVRSDFAARETVDDVGQDLDEQHGADAGDEAVCDVVSERDDDDGEESGDCVAKV